MSHHAMYTILIVDDNPNNLFTLRTLLQANLDTEVIEAESGVVALEKITQQKIDLILLDIQMPELDGFETAKLVRSRKKYQDIPIIFLTAVFKSEEFKEKGLAGGAIDYLTKPIDEAVLINRVSAYLRLLEGERALNRRLEEINAQLQTEIEERKRVESVLAEERNLLRTLIDNVPDFIYVKDTKNRFLVGNKAVMASFGVKKLEKLVGKTDFDFHANEMAEKFSAEEQAVLESEQPLINKEEVVIDQRTGETTWLWTTKVPFRDSRGKIVGLVGIGRDISERKRAEEELERLNQQLKEASQYKTDFLSSMSHEIRTPLNATIGYTSLTLSSLKEKLAPEKLENLIKAERSARTLLQLINDVLDFSKIEAGKMDILIEEIELADIIEDVAITAEGLLLDKPVEVKSDIAPDLPVVESDYTKVKQILNNLVGNAIKFTSEGYVAVRAMPINKGTAVRIEVQDTGGGIPEEKLGTVFESFKQVDSSVKKKYGGTGLGLAITKSFCDMLGLDIGVESEVGKGTTFWLNIPVQAEIAEQELTPGPSQEGMTLPYTSQEGVGGEYQSVLVVDDDDMNLTLLADVFLSAGHTVYSTLSGPEAVDIAREKLPDVIIMDLAMPDLDGFEATQLLKEDPATAGIIIIACSALATEDIQKNALQVGCDGFISKPIQPDTLVKKVAEIVAATRQEVTKVS